MILTYIYIDLDYQYQNNLIKTKVNSKLRAKKRKIFE